MVDRGGLISLGAEVAQGQVLPVVLVRTGPREPDRAAVGHRIMQMLAAAVGSPRGAAARAVLPMFWKG